MPDPSDPEDASIVAGLHAVKAVLKSDSGSVHALKTQRGRRDDRVQVLVELARGSGVSVAQVARAELDRLSGEQAHQGVVALVSGRPAGNEDALFALLASLAEPRLVLVLDEVQDPHNLGACLRSADAAGVQAVVTPLDNSCGITPVVRKVASGAAETVPLFQVVNLPRTLKRLQQSGLWIYGAAGEAPGSLFATDFGGSAALVMGAEGRGLRRLTREHCDVLFHIPMRGRVSSLNVSVATGVSLFEIVRQRTLAG